jgi:uncharacterized protein YegJ (DUF2314 family)
MGAMEPRPDRSRTPLLWILLVAVPMAALLALLLWPRGDAPSVRRVTGEDPALQSAVRQAQDSLDEFVQALENPQPGQRFAIRGRFMSAAGPEYLWVRDPVHEMDVFTGTLDQRPIAVSDLELGATVRVRREDVYDWLIREPDGDTRGAFTERALAP